MHSRTLGRTDVRLSEIGLGTWGLASDAYGPPDAQRFESVVRRALDEGITTFDLAPAWGEGEAERVVGRITRDRRDELQYVTRCGAQIVDGALHHRFDAESIRGDCEGSLERLGTDRLDVLLLHNPPEEVLRREEWRQVMEQLAREGKIRAWGVSVGDPDQARLAVQAGAQCLCLIYNLLLGDDLHDLAGELSLAGCGVLARSPLAYGLLSGRWSPERRFPPGDHRRDRWTAQALRARVQQVGSLRYLVHGKVSSMAAAAIRFVLANAVVTTALVGARTEAQVGAAAACADGPPYLPEEDLMKLPRVLSAVGV